MQKIISPSASAILHVTRFLLALLVAGGHWTQYYFQEDWLDATKTAMRAVAGFFVLSGFTIRMVTSNGTFALDRYVIDRFSRLWSVVLPALLITGFLDYLSLHINPSYYLHHWGRILHAQPVGYQLVTNALFVSQLWDMRISPLSNSPFWSLGYEAWFYVFYGLYVSKRPLFLIVAAVISGPRILFLIIPWVVGVVTYDIFESAKTKRRLAILAAGSFMLAAVLWILGVKCAEGLHQFYGIIEDQYFAIWHTRPIPFQGDYFYMMPGFVFAPALLAFLSAATLLDLNIRQLPAMISRSCVAIGEVTFPLYLLHFPLFVLCGAIGFYNPHSSIQKTAIFVGVCGLIFAITPFTTRLKIHLRKGLFVARDFFLRNA